VCSAHARREPTRKKVVVIGVGWAGFGAAHALVKAGGLDVLLLDTADNPGGLSVGWRTLAGRPVEAGIKGWGGLGDFAGSGSCCASQYWSHFAQTLPLATWPA